MGGRDVRAPIFFTLPSLVPFRLKVTGQSECRQQAWEGAATPVGRADTAGWPPSGALAESDAYPDVCTDVDLGTV